MLLDQPFPRALRLRLKLYLRYSGVPQAGGLCSLARAHTCSLKPSLNSHIYTHHTRMHVPHIPLYSPPTPAHTFKHSLAHPHTHAWTTLLHPHTHTLVHTPSCAPSQSWELGPEQIWGKGETKMNLLLSLPSRAYQSGLILSTSTFQF